MSERKIGNHRRLTLLGNVLSITLLCAPCWSNGEWHERAERQPRKEAGGQTSAGVGGAGQFREGSKGTEPTTSQPQEQPQSPTNEPVPEASKPPSQTVAHGGGRGGLFLPMVFLWLLFLVLLVLVIRQYLYSRRWWAR